MSDQAVLLPKRSPIGKSLWQKDSLITEVRFASFLSDIFTTMAVMNPPERKLVKRTSVHWFTFWTMLFWYLAQGQILGNTLYVGCGSWNSNYKWLLILRYIPDSKEDHFSHPISIGGNNNLRPIENNQVQQSPLLGWPMLWRITVIY